MRKDLLNDDMNEIFFQNINWECLNGKTILISGATGMIASYIVLYLSFLVEIKKYNLKIVCVVRSKNKFSKKFEELVTKDYIDVIENNLEHQICYDKDVDYIIHAASLASPNYYRTNPVDVCMPNILGTWNLLQFAKEKNIKGFLFFSTGDIYGKAVSEEVIAEENYGIVDTLDEHNCYSESKRMGEALCMAFMRQYGVPIKIARIWHTYAPTMDIEKDPRVFASFCKNIVSRKNIEMLSDGTDRRTFCYITDAVSGYFKILIDGEVGNAYNVCNAKEDIGIADLAEILVKLRPKYNLKVVRKEVLDKNYVENSFLKNKYFLPSSQKLESLGWKANVDVTIGFGRVLDYLEDI